MRDRSSCLLASLVVSAFGGFRIALSLDEIIGRCCRVCVRSSCFPPGGCRNVPSLCCRPVLLPWIRRPVVLADPRPCGRSWHFAANASCLPSPLRPWLFLPLTWLVSALVWAHMDSTGVKSGCEDKYYVSVLLILVFWGWNANRGLVADR